MVSSVILVVLWACFLFYFFFLLYNGWVLFRSDKLQEVISPISLPKVSVIIAFRDEKLNLLQFLPFLIQQEYPASLIEILLIDDYSEDGGGKEVVKLASIYPQLKYLHLEGGSGTGKKAAIQYGVSQAEGEIIIATDADCKVNPNWVRSMIRPFQNPKVGFVSGPVSLAPSRSFFEKAQALEFAGLIGVGAASILRRKPNMCNGANLAYRRSVFLNVKGFKGIDGIPSGDDEFLMHKIAFESPHEIAFCWNKDAIVHTAPLSNWKSFKNQRLRWVSKSTHYKKKGITLTLILCWFGLVLFPFLFLNSIFHSGYWTHFIVAFLLKVLCEGIILYQVTSFFSQKSLLRLLPIEQFFHIVYVIWVGLAGNFLKYEWKGR